MAGNKRGAGQTTGPPKKKRTPKGAPRVCIGGCNNGEPLDKSNFSNNQWDKGGPNGSKCNDCVKNRRGPASVATKTRKARGKSSNVRAHNAAEKAAKTGEELDAAMKSGADESKIAELKKRKMEEDALAVDAYEDSDNGKRNARRQMSNDLARAAEKNANEVKDKLNTAMKSGADKSKIAALEKEKMEADALAADAYEKSTNGKQTARRQESNVAYKAAQQTAKEAKQRLAKAMVSGATLTDESEIAALEKQKMEADALAADAYEKSTNGKQTARRQESNVAYKAAEKNAKEIKQQLDTAMKSGADKSKIAALEKKEKMEADALAADAYEKSRNGKDTARRHQRTFPSGFVLDTRTLFDGLDKLRQSRKSIPRTDVSEFGMIISNGFKNDQSVDDVIAALNDLNMK